MGFMFVIAQVCFVLALLGWIRCVIVSGDEIGEFKKRLKEAEKDRDHAEKMIKEIHDSGLFDRETHGPSCPWYEKRERE